MSKAQLALEFLSGPLDGHQVTLDGETPWGKEATSALGCAWDHELGDPQARFFPEGKDWWLEPLLAPHGTYRVTGQEPGRLEDKVRLAPGDILKAGVTWLLMQEGEANR